MNSRLFSVRFGISWAAAFAILGIALILSLQGQRAQEKVADDARSVAFAPADEATRAIRDGSKEIVRVITNNKAERERAAGYGPIVADYGAFVVLATDRNADLSRSGLDHQPIETSISLPGAMFDPIKDPPLATTRPGATEAKTDKGYYIVQFGGIATDEWLRGLSDAGVEILQYVPNNAFFVYADEAAMALARSHPRVRWAGAFLPADKITNLLRNQVAAARSNVLPQKGVSPLEMTGEGVSVFDVAVFKRGAAAHVAGIISSSYGGRVRNVIELPGNYFDVVRVELSLDEVLRVADIPGVMTIDFYSTPRKEDERAAHIVAGNYTSTTVISGPGYNPLTQFGVDGTNVTVSIADDGISIPGNGGFYVTAANTVDGPLRGSTSGASTGHGHLNASIIAGAAPFGVLDPTGHNYGLGVAPKAHITNIPFLKAGYAGIEADVYNDTVITPGPNGVNASISNNSWGDGTNLNVYDSYTAQFDGFVRDATTAGGIDPVLLVFSAGNSGAGASLTRPKAAKNLIATGNSENLRTELSAAGNNMDDLTSSSSRGPAADGRYKPDITAPGTVIAGSRAGNCSLANCFDANHQWSSGTSHAAPQVAGAAALFTQFWKNTNGGVNPSPALVKAAIINTAQEMNGVNTGAAAPNGDEGWGRINMKLMLNTGVPMRRINQTTEFTAPGNNVTLTGTVGDATKPIRVSLVWTDPPGAANANPALVNNLDLTVTIGANTYRGNVFAGGLSTTGGAADTINNVENIKLPAGAAAGTPFFITVSATALNGDGILGNADATDQHFGLVAYNFAEQAFRSRADFDGDGKTDFSVFRPSDGVWYFTRSSGGFGGLAWGTNGDTIVPGDWDGDGKADPAIYRPTNTVGAADFYVLNSNGFTFTGLEWGVTGDIAVAGGDYDGDGRADAAVFRPATGKWYVRGSAGGVLDVAFGQNGDVPMAMDYEGDGLTNLAVYRPADHTWYIALPGGIPGQSFHAFLFGLETDKLVPADYDGDGAEDVAVFRPSTGVWYMRRRSDGGTDAFTFGQNGDIPVPGDYDGDGRDDIGVFRGGTWFVLRSTAGSTVVPFGVGADTPVPKGYVP